MGEDVSHFSMIGFDFDMSSEQALFAALETPLSICEILELKGPNKLCLLRDESGADLWFGIIEHDGALELVTVNPGFRGKGRLPVTFDGFVSDPAWEPYEYKLSVTFGDLQIPFLVELTDPRQKDSLTAGANLTLDVTAFTYDPQFYPDGEAYSQAQRGAEGSVVFAEDHFIPSGMFGGDPSAQVMFGGKILEAELKHGADNSSYWWTLVTTQSGATVNVVFDDASTTSIPKPGELIVGEFWVTARVVSDEN